MSNLQTLTDSEIAKILKQKMEAIDAECQAKKNELEALEDRLDKAKTAFEAYAEYIEPQIKQASLFVERISKDAKITMAAKAEYVLDTKDDFMTSGQILNAINDYFDVKIAVNSFMASWPATWKDDKKPFMSFQFKNNNGEMKYLYGLKKWWAGKAPLPKYEEKLNKIVEVYLGIAK